MDNLTDILTVKAYMGIPVSDVTQDDVITLALGWASQEVRNFLQFDVIEADYIESYDGNESNRIVLRQRPITAMRTVLIGQSTIRPTSALSPEQGFFFDETRVILRGWRFVRGQDNVSIDYTAGYKPGDVPPNIVKATCMAVKAAVSSAEIDPNVQSESVPGAYNAVFNQALGDLPNGAKMLLAPDRRVALT